MVNQYEPTESEVNAWFKSLEYSIQAELLEQVYGEGYPDVNEGWHYLDFKEKLQLYQENSLEA